jgi:hypothetical protein
VARRADPIRGDGDDFDADSLTHRHHVLNALHARGRELRNMDQAILAEPVQGHKGAKGRHAPHGACARELAQAPSANRARALAP